LIGRLKGRGSFLLWKKAAVSKLNGLVGPERTKGVSLDHRIGHSRSEYLRISKYRRRRKEVPVDRHLN
jgi:hypothetical protein